MRQTVEGGATTQFLYDGNELVAEYNGSGPLLRRYVHGRGLDQPLVQYEGTGVTTPIWFHADQLGSVIATTGSAGTATIYAYSATGEPSGGSWTGPRFRYTGQIALSSNAAVHLYYYKARLYDPSLGRFLQTDPIGYEGGMNLYAYAANDPVNSTDPLGLEDYPFPTEQVPGYLIVRWDISTMVRSPPPAVPGQAEEPDRTQDIRTSNERRVTNGKCIPSGAVYVGVTGNRQIGAKGAVTGGAGILFDTSGSIAFYAQGGGGKGIGQGAFGGATMGTFIGGLYDDFAGPFGSVSGTVGAGDGAGIDAFSGVGSRHQWVGGYGISMGAGAGVTSFKGMTYSLVSPSFDGFFVGHSAGLFEPLIQLLSVAGKMGPHC